MNDAPKSYLGNALLKASNVKINFSREEIEEYLKCINDPVYFIETYCKIVTLDHGLQSFKLYECQKKKLKFMPPEILKKEKKFLYLMVIPIGILEKVK